MRGIAPFRRFHSAATARATLCLTLAAIAMAWLPVPVRAADQGSAAASAASTQPVRFVAFGDSLTAGFRTPGPSWPAQLDAMRSDIRLVHNSGVTGDTTADLLARIERDVYAYEPDLLTIFVGLNDLSRCGRVGQVVANIKSMVEGAREHGIPRIVLILNSHTVGWGSQNGHSCGPQLQRNIDLLDDQLIAYGIAAGVQTIDLRPAMDTDGHYTKAFLLSDGVHYSNAGAARVSAVVSAQLSAGYDRYLRGPR